MSNRPPSDEEHSYFVLLYGAIVLAVLATGMYGGLAWILS